MAGGSNDFIIIGGKGGHIIYDEPQFIEDDLRCLVEIDLLRLDYGSKGSRIFYITRAALRLVS